MHRILESDMTGVGIQHTVIFRLIHKPGSANEAEFLRDAEEKLGAISGVRNFSVRRQVSPKSNLQWQFSMDFDDEKSFEAYNQNSVHVGFVIDRWNSEVTEFQEYDFMF